MSDPIKELHPEPCGCLVTEYVSGRQTFAPCIPCGLMRAGKALIEARWWRRGKALREAGSALAAVATTINRTAAELRQKQAIAEAMKK